MQRIGIEKLTSYLRYDYKQLTLYEFITIRRFQGFSYLFLILVTLESTF